MAQTKVSLIKDGTITADHLHANHGITTDNIGEGANLFYTDARVANYLSANNITAYSAISSLTDVNLTGLTNNSVLKYDATAGEWIIGTSSTAQATANVIRPIALAHITTNNYTANSGTGISWGNYQYSAGNYGYYQFTFATAQPNANYTVMTDMGYAGDANISPEVTNKTTTGFRVNMYNDSTGSELTAGSVATNELIVLVYGSDPTETIYADSYSSVGDLPDVDTTTSSPSSGQALVWNGTNWVPGTISTSDDYVTSASFNTSDGVLTLTRTYGGTVTVDLDNRYLTSYTETDPVFSASAASGITSTNISNWNTAYGWGDHASAGYLTSYTETDTLATVTGRGAITTSDLTTGRLTIANNVSTGGFGSFNDYQIILYKDTTASTTYGLGIEGSTFMFHTNGVYRFYANNAVKATISNSGDLTLTGTISASGYNNSNWDTAYGWGNHASAGYLTSLPSHTHDDRYLVKGGSWNGANMPGSRWGGFSANGGEVVFQQDNPNNGQMSVMVDGNFYAGENNGFWSLYSSNSYNSKAGMYADGNGYLILDSPSRVKIKNGSNSQMNINFDQIWTDSGNLHFQYSGSGNIDMNYGGGYTFSRTSLRAPIFYDYNNTSYYIDANGDSVVGQIRFDNATNGWTGMFGNYDLSRTHADNARHGLVINASYYPHIDVNATATTDVNSTHGAVISMTGKLGSGYRRWGMGIAQYNPNELSFGYADNQANPHYGVGLNWSSSAQMWIDTGGNLYSIGSMRSPIFYDYNNTGYYVNPDATSNLYNLQLSGAKHTYLYITPGNGYEAMVRFNGGSGSTWYVGSRTSTQLIGSTDAYHVYSQTTGQTVGGYDSSGNHYAVGSSRAPIFYDSNNTAYFVDANNRSYLNKVTTTGINDTDVWEGAITINGDANTYYPVAWYGGSQSQVCEIEIHRNYSDTAPSTWNTSTHKGGLVFRCSTNFGGWGGVSYDTQVQDFRETYSTMMGWMGHFANSRAFGFRLRGGGAVYYIRIKGRSVGPTVTYGTWDPGNNGTGLGTSTVVDTANIVRRRFASGSRLYSYDNLVLDHGSDHQTKSGILQSNSSLRAPVFYDSNDTNYYIDPADGNLSVKVYGEISNSNAYQGNLQPGALNIGRTDTNYRWEGTSWAGDVRVGILANCLDHWEFAVHDAGESVESVFYYNSGDNMIYMGRDIGWGTTPIVHIDSSRAPIFYDYNNTGYYLDPASTTNLNTVLMNAQTWRGNITWNSGVNINVSGESSFDLLGSSAIWQVWTANNSQPSIYVTYAGQTEIGLAGNRGLKVHGNLTVNHSSTYGTGMDLTFSGSSATGMLIRNNTGSTKAAISFFYSSAPQGARGTIMVSSTSTAYNTSSDYRLKENFEPITDGIDRVKLLQPKRFNFIGDDKTVDGFVAHETQEVVPESITGVKDEVDEDGNPVYQGIDQAKLVPLLTAALQEAIAKIESLEARIQVLENQ